jgi:hypothetical protein
MECYVPLNLQFSPVQRVPYYTNPVLLSFIYEAGVVCGLVRR